MSSLEIGWIFINPRALYGIFKVLLKRRCIAVTKDDFLLI